MRSSSSEASKVSEPNALPAGSLRLRHFRRSYLQPASTWASWQDQQDSGCRGSIRRPRVGAAIIRNKSASAFHAPTILAAKMFKKEEYFFLAFQVSCVDIALLLDGTSDALAT